MVPGIALVLTFLSADQAAPDLREEAARALRRACEYFRNQVAVEGGYVWRYSLDLSRREGEGDAGRRAAWVQPPGTPAVGLAFLEAHEATGDRFFLEAACEATRCLLRGQLRSGGWTYRIELDPEARVGHAYRSEPEGKKRRNVSTLDDDTTQCALRLLLKVDRALRFEDAAIHEAALHALERLLAAQHSNGGFPQGFDGPAEPRPVRRASYPASWPRTHPPQHRYWLLPTLNDGVLENTIDVLLEASRVYEDPRYREAALRAGDMLLIAQMPEPQPGWAQQYDLDMQPTWARKFEPPAISGGEGQGAMQALLELYRATADRKYLDPLPRALAYYRRSLLPDGRLARFYELQTNRPLYFTRDYRLTHDDGDLPRHYAFKVSSKLDGIEREHARLLALKPDELAAERLRAERRSAPGEEEVRRVIAGLDGKGRWFDAGALRSAPEVSPIVASETFIRNTGILARFLGARTRP